MILALHVSWSVLHFSIRLLQVNLDALDGLEDRNQQLQLFSRRNHLKSDGG